MSKKYSSRATKMVLASLLVASMTVPSFASANAGEVVSVGGTDATTRTEVAVDAVTTSVEVAERTINFTISKEVSSYIKGPAKLVKIDGVEYMHFDLVGAATKNMITAMTVEGKNVLVIEEGSKEILVPVAANYAAVKGSVTMDVPFGGVGIVSYEFTITPEADSIKEVVPEVDTTKVVSVATLPDGIYSVKYTMLKEDKAGVSSAARNFSDTAVLKVVNGKATVELTATLNQHMILGLQTTVNGKLTDAAITSKTMNNYTKTISVPVETVGNALKAYLKMDYSSVPQMASSGITGHDIFIQLDANTLATEGSVYVLQDGTDKGSIMNGTYLNPQTSIKAVEAGYEVTVSFPKGKYIQGFKVEGKDAEVVQAPTTSNPEAKYKFVVKNIKDLVKASIHIDVNEPAAGVIYNMNHAIEFKFSGKTVAPFSDVEGSWAKTFISDLYAKGIFKEDKKFNPTNKTERYQFALMLQRAMKLEVPTATKFTDLPTDAEAVNAIKALNNAGVIKGLTDTTFNPSGSISRQDTALMIHRLLKANNVKDVADAKTPFTDVKLTANSSDYEKEAAAAIAQLYAQKIINGATATTFAPTGTLTREAMAKILVNTLEVLGK